MAERQKSRPEEVPEHQLRRRRIFYTELRKRIIWFIRLRWLVPPGIAAGVFVANVLGFEFNVLAVLLVAVFILLYNIAFQAVRRRIERGGQEKELPVQRFTYFQVGFDYLAMFLLVHFTGGAASPFIFFFVLHVIFASILLPDRRWAYAFAGLSAVGMSLIAAAEYHGLIPHHPILYGGRAIDLAGQPSHMFVEILFFSASVFVAAFISRTIMRMLRLRILALDQSSAAMVELNDKLNALYHMVQAIGARQRLKQVLQVASENLTGVMGVRALSVKLLNEDGGLLKYAAAYGLPESLSLKNSIILGKSPLNRRIIEGESFVTGNISQQDMFQFGEDMEAAGLKSVLFVPLKAEEKVIGILGAYCVQPDRFCREDVEFFQLAADLVAIAIENARAYENIESMMEERSRFMLKVAHNLRAPLAAAISILNVVREGYLGEMDDKQNEYLRRVDRRARTMWSMVNELMSLARSRSRQLKIDRKPVDLRLLSERLQRTFQDSAAQKGLGFKVQVPKDLPKILGDQEMLEQILENLVSNAIKYTRAGSVEVDLSRSSPDQVSIEVRDTGIGIPEKDRSRLFSDFFRAENAKDVEQIGTGLGLALVKEAVEKHAGEIELSSKEDEGTTFIVTLPIGGVEIGHESAGDKKVD